MPKQTLLDLSSDVTRLLVAGAAQAPGDDGLRRKAQRLRELSKQVPALAPIADVVDKVLAAPPRQAASALLDLSAIVRQVRAGLASSGTTGPLESLPAGIWATPTAQRDVGTLLELLNGSATMTNRLEQLKEALQRSALADMRLIQPLVQALGDGHAAFAELVATQALPGFGPSVVPFVESGLNFQGKALDARRLLAICSIDSRRGKELCLQALEDGSTPVKVQALQCLGTLDPQAVEQVALRFLADPKSEIRAAAVVALAGATKDEVLDAIVGLLDDTKEVWTSATKSLAKFAHRGTTGRLVRELEKAVTDWDAVPPDAKTKPASAKAKPVKAPAKPKASAQEKERMRLQERIARLTGALSARPDRKRAADTLMALASHPIADLRVAAIGALGAVGELAPEKVAPVLTAALADKNAAVKEAAVIALGNLGPKSADVVTVLLGVLQDGKAAPQLRQVALKALRGARDPRVFAALIQCLGDKEFRRTLSHWVLLDIVSEDSALFTMFLNAARNKKLDKEHRFAVLNMFCHYKPDVVGTSVVNDLIALLDDKEVYVRDGAINVLHHVGTHALPAVPKLLKLMERDGGGNAWMFLDEIEPGGATSIPALTSMLGSTKPAVVVSALGALIRYRKQAASAARAVSALLEHKLKPIRDQAKVALEQIK